VLRESTAILPKGGIFCKLTYCSCPCKKKIKTQRDQDAKISHLEAIDDSF